jgi:hypothetical protein
MVKVIDSGLSGITDTEDTLGRLWRILLYNTNIRPQQWHTQLSKWESKMRTKRTDKDSTSLKGNITQQLSKPRLTWGALLTGFSILGYTRLDIKLTLWRNDKATELNLTVNNLTDTGED